MTDPHQKPSTIPLSRLFYKDPPAPVTLGYADGVNPSITWQKGVGPALDMTGLALTFDTSPRVADVYPTGGAGPWFAPIHATSGAARFASPTDPVNPFSNTSDGFLRLRCEKVAGQWQTGHMQTSDFDGRGFAQQRGYFEIRCKMPLPGTMGAWPAFWLYSRTNYTNTTKPRAEIDVMEYYPGADPRGHHSAIHLRPGLTQPLVTKHWFVSCYNGLDALLDGGWHTYGCEVTPAWIIVYFDRVEIKRIRLAPEFDTPLYMLVSLQLLDVEAAAAVSPIDLLVDYVRVWQRQ